MDENIGYNGAYSGAEIDAAIGAVKNKETTWDGKQDKLTGVQGQVVGFDDEGDAIAMPAPDTGVTTFNGRTGAVTPQAGDYTAAMVGARADNWMPTADEVGAVPVGRTVNGKPLNADITLGAGDVGAVPTTTTVNGKSLSGNISLTADDVGARPNTWTPTADDVGAIPASQKGANNGIAELDSTGRVPSTQLPSYVDDVLEYASFSNFPQTGEDGKIYIAEDTNRQYRWSGSQYVEISPSLALGETSSTAYRGDRGAIAYTHSQTTGNPHNTTAAEVGAVPTSRTVNGHALSDNISLTADDVGARSTNWTPTAADVGAVPTSRTVNGKALSANITLNASDVGAATEAQVEAAKPMLVTIAGNDGSYTADKTPAEIIAAYQAGQTIYAVYNNVRVPMCELLDGYICIFTLDYGTMYDVFIYEYEGSVSVEVTETPAKVTTFKNISIFTTTMTWSTHSITELNEQGYTQRVAIPLSHITLSHSPTLVSFSVADRYSGNWSDYCDTYDGGLYLYAKAQQTATIDNAVFTLID